MHLIFYIVTFLRDTEFDSSPISALQSIVTNCWTWLGQSMHNKFYYEIKFLVKTKGIIEMGVMMGK